MSIRNKLDILYIEFVLYRHFRSKIINRSALNAGVEILTICIIIYKNKVTYYEKDF